MRIHPSCIWWLEIDRHISHCWNIELCSITLELCAHLQSIVSLPPTTPGRAFEFRLRIGI